MLVLTRRVSEGITITVGDVTLHVVLVASHAGSARLGFDAPPTCVIQRDELLMAAAANADSARSALPDIRMAEAALDSRPVLNAEGSGQT